MSSTGERVLVTGAAGFIGFHLCRYLLKSGASVLGVDNMSDYYSVQLKLDRLKQLENEKNFSFTKLDICDHSNLEKLFSEFQPTVVIHLAAQAGVRYSIENPRSYFDSNLEGTFNILECSRNASVNHFMMASTSSVYGANNELPFTENQKADWQMSFYAATKKSCENISHSYSHIYGMPVTLFRFFTVYGPWGRPDMALFKFTDKMLRGDPIDVFNFGRMTRDFTFIDDLVSSITKLMECSPASGNRVIDNDSISPVAPWRVVNIGNQDERALIDYIKTVEAELGVTAKKNLLPMQPGDVKSTMSDCSLLRALIGTSPVTPIEDGVKAFVEWYRRYYGL